MAQGFVAIHAGHHDIEQDQVRIGWVTATAGRLARVGDTDMVFALQQATDHRQVVPVVIDDENGADMATEI